MKTLSQEDVKKHNLKSIDGIKHYNKSNGPFVEHKCTKCYMKARLYDSGLWRTDDTLWRFEPCHIKELEVV
jgi:hypothetical protein